MSLTDFYLITRQNKITLQHKSNIIKYDVLWNDAVRQLKERICKKKVMLSDAFVLVYEGRELHDQSKWWQNGVLGDDDPVVHLCER